VTVKEAGPFAQALDRRVIEGALGTLYEKLADNKVRCYACAHQCLILDGLRGICKVRYNQGGTLMVPHGYVGALQCDPTEKKPFFHVFPGSDALTMGMLGCDLHCSYCFSGDVQVATSIGVRTLAELWDKASETQSGDAERRIPRRGLMAIGDDGEAHAVRWIFRHPYHGPIIRVTPKKGPALEATPDHPVLATENPGEQGPVFMPAGQLTPAHYLAAPVVLSASPVTPAGHAKALAMATVAPTEGTDTPTLTLPLRGRGLSAVAEPNYFFMPIAEVKVHHYDGHVFNIETLDRHTYLANGYVVHNCQNWVTSQALRDPGALSEPMDISPRQLVDLAQRYDAKLVATSYNEPLITSEWAVDVFKEAKRRGFTTAYISNGNATRQVLEYIRPWTNCYKIDLKSMRDKNYRSLGGKLENILNGIRMVHEMGFWLEIVTLTIPGFNDSDEELGDIATFLAGISPAIPWHVTAFHKDYKMLDPDNTPAETLIRGAKMGEAAGLQYIYAGNLPGRVGEYENTRCPRCQATLIRRFGYRILEDRLSGSGRCFSCGNSIPGVWN
jgi:pyruvate formate lyase activating enzyme